MQWLLPLSLATEILGYWLYIAPRGPDEAHSLAHASGAFLLFVFWLLSLVSWGLILSRIAKIELRLSHALWLGSLFLSLIIFPLDFLQQLHFGPPKLTILVLLLGPAITSLMAWRRHWHWKCENTAETHWLSAALVCVPFCFIALLSFYPNTFPDPLIYHMAAARKWVEQGSLGLPLKDPNIYYASYWDHLYVWPQLLLGGRDGGGLLLAHLFSQWIHVAVAGIGSLFFLRRIFAALFPDVNGALWLQAIAVSLCSLSLQPTLNLANNDWGVALWFLASLAILLEAESPLWLAGLSLGIAAFAKMTVLFPCLAAFALLVFTRRNPKQLAIFFAAFIFGVLPILIRNRIATGDPFYPALSGLFPISFWGPTWQNIVAYEGRGIQFAALPTRIWDLARESYFCIGLLALPFLFKQQRKTFWFGVFFLVAYLTFALKAGPKAEPRLFGPGLLLLTGLGFLCIMSLLPSRWRSPYGSAILVAVVIVLSQPIPWRSPLLLARMESLPLELRKHDSGQALAWLRLNTKWPTQILSVSEPRLYYLIPQNAERLWDDAELDRDASTCRSKEELFQLFYTRGVEFVLITHALFDTYNSSQVWTWVNQASQEKPAAIRFTSPAARILSVSAYLEAPALVFPGR